MQGEYHLTARPNRKAKNRIWYAWYLDEKGKRIYQSTSCRLKSDALQKIEQWKKEEKRLKTGTLNSFTKGFFEPGCCPYLNWKKNLKPHTIYEHKKNLKMILEKYGSRYPSTISAPEVEKWLESHNRKASWKNGVINTFRIILNELKRDGVLLQIPEFRRAQGKGKRADAFTAEETSKLFPDDEIDLALIWTRCREKIDKDTGEVIERTLDKDDKAGLLFGILFRVMLHAGMRPGEVRALEVKDIYPKFNGIHISQQIDSTGKVALLKKADNEDRRERLVKVPAITMQLLTTWMERHDIKKGFVFLYNEAPIRKEYLEDRFVHGIKNAGIKIKGRRLIPYSLRYTYRSRVEGYLKRQQIMDAMGHKSDEMSLHYLHVHPDQFRAMEVEQERVEKTWEYL